MKNEEIRQSLTMENFEQHLQRQQLRRVPSLWRQEILAAAKTNRRDENAQHVSEDRAALLAGWRLLFARLPLAWATLAALWVALIGVNLMMPSPMVRVTGQTSPSVRMETLAALDLQPGDLEALGWQFSPAPEASPVNRTPAVPVRPRSERRRDAGFGVTRPDFFFDLIA
jgi:hypothetical protein